LIDFDRAAKDFSPRQNNRAERPGLARAGLPAFFPNAVAYVLGHLCKVAFWVNQNGAEAGKVIGAAMQQQEACIGSHTDTNFISDDQTAAALEIFLRHENVEVARQFLAIGLGQVMIKRAEGLDNPPPDGR
jgi:hypothetical protein